MLQSPAKAFAFLTRINEDLILYSARHMSSPMIPLGNFLLIV